MTAFELRLQRYLTHLYGERAGEVQRRLEQHLAHFRPLLPAAPLSAEQSGIAPTWSEKDQWVISYGDSIVADGTPPLGVLNHFLQRHLGETISGVHVLPFFPLEQRRRFFRHPLPGGQPRTGRLVAYP